MARAGVKIRSLLAATDVDVLPDSSIVADRGEYVVVRTPSNPTYHWGNFLLWRRSPERGDRARWEAAFLEEFADSQELGHVALGWDVPGEEGEAFSEFVTVGYEPDRGVALVADPHELVDHPRLNREVEVRALDPDEDAALWDAVLDLQVANREPGHTEAYHRRFVTDRMANRRERFRAGDGAWYVALLPDGTVAGSCGVIVTEGRARYQAVDTATEHRRRGIASRLVVEAGRHAVEHYGARQLVIGADADYHALPLYESLGFRVREQCLAVCWWPGAPNADRHPSLGGRLRQTRGLRGPTAS